MSLPFPEYPRPQLRRDNWVNLNGLWDYAITQSDTPPTQYDGTILVPYSPECNASGVRRVVGEADYLWYRRRVTLEPDIDKRYLLHFGAVDQCAVVYWNGQEIGRHSGGYLPFTLEVTEALCENNELVVAVQDATDHNEQLRGKQKTRRGGIWYTPQSGIWQTVWLEPVPKLYITGLRITPKPSLKQVEITVQAEVSSICYVMFQGRSYGGITNKVLRISMPEFIYWTPETPHLYDFSVTLAQDCVESYFAMRSLSVGYNAKGQPCLLLNDKPLFQSGVLDQGYWPEGLYTPPSDEAFVADIQNMKALGFNMLRKHIKVEPLRFYYHCDRLGMLVWQDMVNGGGHYSFATVTAPLFTGIHLKDTHYRVFAREDASCRRQFRTELMEMVSHLYNCPSIVMWVIFNEGWGQFDSVAISEQVRNIDNTRWIDHASGWHDQGIGDIMSRHVYFVPYRFRKDRFRRPVALSEFGGYTSAASEASGRKLFGYTGNKNKLELDRDLKKLFAQQILPAVKKGLGACVYTQVSDVEDEQNGFYSFDRSICKVIPEHVRKLNAQLYSAFSTTEPE